LKALNGHLLVCEQRNRLGVLLHGAAVASLQVFGVERTNVLSARPEQGRISPSSQCVCHACCISETGVWSLHQASQWPGRTFCQQRCVRISRPQQTGTVTTIIGSVVSIAIAAPRRGRLESKRKELREVSRDSEATTKEKAQ